MELNAIATYPTNRADWIKTVLIGGILIFLGFLVVPIVLVYGYVVQTMRGSLAGESEPPAFEEWSELAVDGVKAWVIAIVYQLIPLIVASVTVGGAIAAIVGGGEAGLGGAALGVTISAILALVFGYLAVAALVNFAREERLGAAFDVGVIKTVALSREFAIAWLVSLVAFIVVGIVTMIPLLGWLLTPFVSFYAAVVAANLLADGFARSMGPPTGVNPTTDGETAI